MTKAALILSLTIIIFTACAETPEQANSTPNIKEISANLNDPDSPERKANDHIEELGDLINMQAAPTDAKWREESKDGIRTLTAVIRFEKADADKLETSSANHGEMQSVDIPVQEWFQSELITQGEFSADLTLKGRSYPANEILKEPFNTGKLTRIEDTDYFIAEIAVK